MEHPTNKDLMASTPPPLPVISKKLNDLQNKFVSLLFLNSFDPIPTIKSMMEIDSDSDAMANAMLFMKDPLVAEEVERIRKMYTREDGIINTAISMKLMQKVLNCESPEDFANLVNAARKWMKGDTKQINIEGKFTLEDRMIEAYERDRIIDAEVIPPKELTDESDND